MAFTVLLQYLAAIAFSTSNAAFLVETKRMPRPQRNCGLD